MRRAICSGVGAMGLTNGCGGGGGGRSGRVEGTPRWMVSVREFAVGTVTEASMRMGRTTLRGGGAGGVNGRTSNDPGTKVLATALPSCTGRLCIASSSLFVMAGSPLAGDSGSAGDWAASRP